MSFMNDNYLLTSETAKRLYTSYAREMPVCDYHCHLSPKEIYLNQSFFSITEAWLKGDHYKWRLLRAFGVDEKYITGNASDIEKFEKWAEVMEYSIGNPVYTWCHGELISFFDIHTPLSRKTWREIYQEANERLKTLKPRDMITMSRVKVICTTDDPIDSLEYHKLLQEDFKECRVLPSYRPDKALNINLDTYNSWVDALEEVCGRRLLEYSDFQKALAERLEYFLSLGCRVTDHSLEGFSYRRGKEQASEIYRKKREGGTLTQEEIHIYKTETLEFLAKEYSKRGLGMQLHIGAMRNNNPRAFAELGVDTGFDAMSDLLYIHDLSQVFGDLEKENSLPRTIVYSLNDNDNRKLAALIGCFNKDMKGKMQLGSAWWFNDHRSGIYRQLDDLAEYGMLSGFVGMLTDSRSFLSYPRHDYFRRVLCSYIAELVDGGLYPEDSERLKEIIENICYYNAMSYFGF